MSGDEKNSHSSGEVQVLMLALLKENRDDTKSMIGQLAEIKTEARATKSEIAVVKEQLASGAEKFDDYGRRIESLERKSVTSCPREEREPKTGQYLRGSIRMPDLATMVKIGALIAALIVGVVGGKAIQITTVHDPPAINGTP